jgi:hypothetical protein
VKAAYKFFHQMIVYFSILCFSFVNFENSRGFSTQHEGEDKVNENSTLQKANTSSRATIFQGTQNSCSTCIPFYFSRDLPLEVACTCAAHFSATRIQGSTITKKNCHFRFSCDGLASYDWC